MSIPIFQIDAFTSEAFRGNPAAVCFLDRAVDAQWMQSVAAEMNLAETAFVRPLEGGIFELRWFTPTVEVDLCGHATLAAAHAMWENGILPRDQKARFSTRSGMLICTSGEGGWIEMDFPATPAEITTAPKGLLDSLGLADAIVAKSKFDYLIEIGSPELLRALVPDIPMLKRVPSRGIIVTSKGFDEFDFASRFFAPRSGIDEDPVTGSAHCALGPWWGTKLKKKQMLAHQASKRAGVVRVTLNGDRVLLGGQAVTALRGELTC